MRSRETRTRAESALAGLVRSVGSHAAELVVVGGLNADLLTDPSDAPHQGTVDVDLLIRLAVVYDRDEQDFGWLERGLKASGFTSRGPGWRWARNLDGFPVTVELPCDVYDNPGQEIALPGCAHASAQNLRGPAAALATPVVRAVPGSCNAGEETLAVQFARLGGYLLAKAAAAHHRDLQKDYYDFAFHLLHNSNGGPTAAGAAAREALPPEWHMDYRRVFVAVLDSYTDPTGAAARAYAEQRVRDGVDLPVDVLAQDAVAAAAECRVEFDRALAGGGGEE